MNIPWGPIGSVAGAGIDAWSQHNANKANAKNVQAQIQFQKDQSETAYQRAVEDMKKAGLNPANAYNQGGNSNQAGAAAKAEPIAQNSPTKFAQALDVYQTIANGAAQRDLLREQSTAAGASARLTETQAAALRPDAIAGRDDNYVGATFRAKMAERIRQTEEHANYPARFRADMASLGAGTAQSQAAAAEARSRTTLNEQDFQNQWFRKNLSPYINSTAKTVGLFSGVKNLTRQ